MEKTNCIISDSSYDQNVYVQQVDAKMRKEYIDEVDYDFKLALPKGDHYWGAGTITFTVTKQPLKTLFLDFRGVSISSLTINGQNGVSEGQGAEVFRNHKVFLDSSLLKVGEKNTIELMFFNKYRKDGCGLHSFTDTADQEQYLYTQFEADYCHWVLPVFDQPDLKGTFTSAALAPEDWTVVSNELSDEKDDEGLKAKLKEIAERFEQDISTVQKCFLFPTSPRLSTYLYAICAGKYAYYSKEASESYPPMRIYMRASLKEEFDPTEMFMVTQVGMKAYNDIFGIPYPFKKYDQIFVPEHNFGAMENVGLVTYNENYMFRGEAKTLAKRLRFSITNLHELAHMWFGNLVTMKWWNDLWLNESFATFMSFLAMTSAPELSYFNTAWVTFLQYKYWGINTDQLSTTHPITCEIKSTDEAESLFDGISYGKGSSFLKQMYNVLGGKVFAEGLNSYFKKYSWQNTQLTQFVACLQEAFDQFGDKSVIGQDFNFTEWCDSWLNSSGVNILEPITEIQDNNIVSLKVRQSLGLRGKNILRTHKIDIGLIDSSFNIHCLKDIIISEKNEFTGIDISHIKDVQGVILNFNDHGYLKARFDEKTWELYKNDLHKISDPVVRAQVWRISWLLVLDKQLSSLQYIDFVLKQLPYEKVEQIIQVALMNLSSLINVYIPEENVLEKQQQLFETLLSLLSDDSIDSGNKNTIVDNMFGFISHKDHVSLAIQWLESENSEIFREQGKPIFKLEKKHKYSLLKAIFKSTDIDATLKNQLLDKIVGEDKSDQANHLRLTCEASLPDPEIKQNVWSIITDPDTKESLYQRSARMGGFYGGWSQNHLVEGYFDKFYDFMPKIYEKSSFKYLESFFYSLLPRRIIKDEHIIKLVSLNISTPDNQQNFKNIINDGIELCMRSKEIRDFARQK